MEKGDNVRRGSNSGAAAVREDEVEEDPEEQLDPRIQVELEKLNSLTDVINKLELDLEVSCPDSHTPNKALVRLKCDCRKYRHSPELLEIQWANNTYLKCILGGEVSVPHLVERLIAEAGRA